MEVSAYKRKFKQLFDTILKDDIEISVYHSENILKHLDVRRDNSTGKILETPFFTELMIYVLKNYSSATTSVKVFIVNILRIVLRNEVHFNRFLSMGGFDLLAATSQEGCGAMPTALHLAYVQQLHALTAHYSGVKYLTDQRLCRRVLRPYTHHRPPALAHAIYDFMSKLIWKLNEYDEEAALLEALQLIVQPIATVDFESATNLGVECEKVISDQVVTYLHTLLAILGEIEHLLVPNKVIPILTRFGVVESKLRMMLEETREPALAGLLGELSLRYHLAAGRQAALREPAAADRLNEDLNMTFDKIVTCLVKKRSIPTILDCICKCHIYWYRLEAAGHVVSFEKFGRRYEMRDQCLLFMMLPLFTKCKSKQRLVDDRELQEAFETFAYGLAERIPRDTINSAYCLRALVEEWGTAAACVEAARQLRRLGRRLVRRQAGVVFQTLYYTLNAYMLSDGAGALVLVRNPLRAPEDEQLVGAALDVIKMLLEEHDISWYESLEIMNLQAALMNLIKQNILPVKLLVQVLELLGLSVRQLLSPELALLLQSARGGSLGEAGAAARALLAWQEAPVRVAALALVHSFTEVAYVKFTALRRVISEHGLLAGAARAALGDQDPRARASGLRCLAAGSRCQCLWAELLTQHHDLYEQLVYILRNNPDGDVRTEAATVLTNIYINHKVTRAFVSRVSRVMARAAGDASRGAQLAALDFWKQLMKARAADRGIIDNRFPAVTFSKEKRKIITLTDEEIRKQLQTFMDCLSASGCLGVLLKCIAPHNHVDVIEKAYTFCRGIVGALEFYKFSDDKPAASQQDIIWEIFACTEADCSREDDPPPVRVPPHVFVETIRATDYDALIKSKKLAAEPPDLDALLDEVVSLGNNQHSNIGLL